MQSRRKTVPRKVRPRPILTLTQRVERLERHYFGQKLAVPAPGPRFTVRDDVVQDASTGLMWTRKNVGGKRLAWSAAKDACNKARDGGFEDWRLPTIQELLSLVDYSRTSPAIDTNAFECESSWYWTSTPYASSSADVAWFVDFDGGSSYYGDQSSEVCVRAVRSGQLIGTLV